MSNAHFLRTKKSRTKIPPLFACAPLRTVIYGDASNCIVTLPAEDVLLRELFPSGGLVCKEQ